MTSLAWGSVPPQPRVAARPCLWHLASGEGRGSGRVGLGTHGLGVSYSRSVGPFAVGGRGAGLEESLHRGGCASVGWNFEGAFLVLPPPPHVS